MDYARPCLRHHADDALDLPRWRLAARQARSHRPLISAQEDQPMTRITAHRGARNLWPENSLTGFRNVLALDVDAIEFDVHLTDTGELVVIHDATLDRTTDATGPVCALTPERRMQVRLAECGEPIPTLADVLAVLASSGRELHVEIKSDADGAPYPGIVAKVAAELDRTNLHSRCHLTSFDV